MTRACPGHRFDSLLNFSLEGADLRCCIVTYHQIDDAKNTSLGDRWRGEYVRAVVNPTIRTCQE